MSVFDDTATTITATIGEELRLTDADDSHYVGFRSGGVVPVNTIWTLPLGDGDDGQVLQTDGVKGLSWNDHLLVASGGPSIRDNAGVLEVKNTDGSAYAALKALQVTTGDLEMICPDGREGGHLVLVERPWGLELQNKLNGKRYRMLMAEIVN